MKKLKESPDSVYIKGKHEYITWKNKYAYAFAYVDGKMEISLPGETHDDIARIDRNKMDYPGRFWTNYQIISFWKYPENNVKMKKICKDLSDEFYKKYKKRIDFYNDYKVEIIVDSDTKEIQDKFSDMFGNIDDESHIEIIPVKQYKSSLFRSDYELNLPHVMSPIEKEKKGIVNKIKGFGADKRYKLPSNFKNKIKNAFSLDDIPPFLKHNLELTSDSVIKLKKLVEYTIAKLSRNINVKIDIDKTKHASERQFRHENPISDEEIINIVNLALPEIANELMLDRLDMHSYVLIKRKDTNINIVGALHPGKNGEIDFVVVTVMKKENFIPKKGTKVIEV